MTSVVADYLLNGANWRLFVSDKTIQRFTGQLFLVFQVAIGNQLPFGMFPEPTLTVAQKFFYFVIANPIVFVVIQDRYENVKMGEQILQSRFGLKCDREVPAVTPLWKFLVERMLRGRDLISKWLEQTPEHALTTATR